MITLSAGLMSLMMVLPPPRTLRVIASDPNQGQLHFPNVQLVDESGKSLFFYNDLIKGKTVAINFIFTNCPSVCPIMGTNFAGSCSFARVTFLEDSTPCMVLHLE